MSGWIRSSFLKDEVGPGLRGTRTAASAILANTLVIEGGEDTVDPAGPDNAEFILGAYIGDVDLAAGDVGAIAYSGEVDLVADLAISAGDLVKVSDDGKVIPALTSGRAGSTIDAVVGLGFGNQPANDGLEIGSDNAADTMQVTVYGTTNGGVVVVKETITLTGTTFVSTVKTDWGVILGVEIPLGQRTALGTITVREASGNATVTTILTGVRYKGIVLITDADAQAYNHLITAEGDAATTKVVGVVGTDDAGDEVLSAVTLAATAVIPFLAAFRTVDKLLVGDLEVARTATFKTDTVLDKESAIVGRAMTDAVADQLVTVVLGPFVNDDEAAKPFSIVPVQTIAMADAQVALVYTTAIAGQKKLTGQILLVDAESSGTEDLLLPPEATSTGLWLLISNTGGEDIVVKDDGDAVTVCTISTTESAFVTCDGTTWRGGVVSIT